MLHSKHTNMIFNILPWKLTMKFFYPFSGMWSSIIAINLIIHQLLTIWAILSMLIISFVTLYMDGSIYRITCQSWWKGDRCTRHWVKFSNEFDTNKHLSFVIFLQWKWNDIPSFVYLKVQLRKRKTNVDINDVNGAAIGIIRLFSEYR